MANIDAKLPMGTAHAQQQQQQQQEKGTAALRVRRWIESKTVTDVKVRA